MPTEYEGACHCGKVRYSFAAAPEATFFCHCNDCQRTAGSPFSVELMVSSESFEVHGELRTYTVVGDSGKQVHRRFCPLCGSGIYLECDADPGYVFLKAGTLNDSGWVKPDMHIYTAAKQPWVELRDTLPRYEKAPDEGLLLAGSNWTPDLSYNFRYGPKADVEDIAKERLIQLGTT